MDAKSLKACGLNKPMRGRYNFSNTNDATLLTYNSVFYRYEPARDAIGAELLKRQRPEWIFPVGNQN